MCRWLAYWGAPVLIEQLLYSPAHSLIDQSLHSRMGAETTNGDGFGIGWYDEMRRPGVFRSVEPAWNDRNLHDLAHHIRSPVVFAHIRASSGSPIQQTNCHPFRHKRWLWMHNGLIGDFHKIKRDLVFAIDPDLYPLIEGSTDSETLFYVALTYGLEEDPPQAVARAIGLVEAVAAANDVEHPMQGTIATSNGDKLWAFRYSSEHNSRTLFFSTAIDSLRKLYPDNPLFQALDEDTRLVVSEPLGDLPGAWNEVPESSWGVVHDGGAELHDFAPVAPD